MAEAPEMAKTEQLLRLLLVLCPKLELVNVVMSLIRLAGIISGDCACATKSGRDLHEAYLSLGCALICWNARESRAREVIR